MLWQRWTGRSELRFFSYRAAEISFMHVSPSFARGRLVLLVCRVYTKFSPWALLSLAGECTHCCSWFREFEDPQCSERRCRTVSMCSQKQPGQCLFKTCNSGCGRWVTLASGSSSICWPDGTTELSWVNLKYQFDIDKNILGWPKRQGKGKEGKWG